MKESINKSFFTVDLDPSLALGNRRAKSAIKGGEEELFKEPSEGIETVDLFEETPDGKTHELGFCTFKEYKTFIYGSWFVREDALSISQDETVGDILVKKFNSIIKKRGKPGILGSVIPKGTSAYNLYKRNGWEEFPFEDGDPGTVWMVYNVPKNITREQIIEMIKEAKADDPYFTSHEG